MKFNIKNKKIIMITVTTSIVLSIAVVGFNNRGYRAEERQYNLGRQYVISEMEDHNIDIVTVTNGIIFKLHTIGADRIVPAFQGSTQKENDDSIFGTIDYSRQIFKNVDKLTAEEFMKKMGLQEADTEDIEEFKSDVTPILKDMAKIEDSILNKDFNGTTSKANADAFRKLYKEFDKYLDRYNDKAWDYYIKTR